MHLVLSVVAQVALPDISVFGPYTYLATEVMWGTVAVALLWYADAFRAAGRVVAVVYLPAYVWDWYTLQVGVFEIPLRTGVNLLGIPIEEHIFMILVPSLVVGVHESIEKIRAERATATAEESAGADD
jgi:lycopene cyclase domain-containing protein